MEHRYSHCMRRLRRRLRILLQHCTNPYELQAMSDGAILELYRTHRARASPTLLVTLSHYLDQAVLSLQRIAAPQAVYLEQTLPLCLQVETLVAER